MSAAPSVDAFAEAYRPPMEVAASFLDRAPVPLMEMAAALGLEVTLGALPSGVSGQIVRVRHRDGNRYHIEVNKTDSDDRQRFTLAHEIAHFLLHREFLDGKVEDDRMYRSRLGDRMERQANRMAAQLLMPGNLDTSKNRAFCRFEGGMERLTGVGALMGATLVVSGAEF